MGKQIVNSSNGISPKKNFMPDMKVNGSIDDEHNDNINMNLPHTNDNKKIKKEGENGTGKTSDNQQVEQERNNTYVSDFGVPSMMQEQLPEMNSSSNKAEGNEQDNEDNDLNGDDSRTKSVKSPSAYVQFFKFYYEKTKKEHPNWTPSQITIIVSLLWKKKKVSDQVSEKPEPSKKDTNGTKRSRALSAKDAFKIKHANLPKEKLSQIWSQLPNQSKIFWKKQGESYYNPSAKLSDVSSVKNGRAQTKINNMRFLLSQN